MIQSDSDGERLVVEATKDTRHVCSPAGTVAATYEPGAGLATSGVSLVICHSNPRLFGPRSMVPVGGPAILRHIGH